MTWVIETLARGVLVTKCVGNQLAEPRYAFATLEEAVKFVRGYNPLPSQGLAFSPATAATAIGTAATAIGTAATAIGTVTGTGGINEGDPRNHMYGLDADRDIDK